MAKKNFFFSIISFLLLVGVGACENASEADQPEIPNSIDSFLSDYEEYLGFSGYVIVARGGDVVFERGYGKANFEFDIPNTRDTKFRIGSMAKTFTKLAIGKLYDDGLVSFEDPLSKYLPDFPKAEIITIDHLMSHTSGVAHTNSTSWGETRGKTAISLEELIELLKTEPFAFEPGTDSAYSNGGYALLAAIIETASGKSYARFMREDILDPMEMNNSGFEGAYEVLDRLANGYQPGPKPFTLATPRFLMDTIKIGGGGFYSTPADIQKLYGHLYKDNIVRKETWEKLFPKDRGVFQSQGRRPGYFADTMEDLESGIKVIVLSNMYLGLFSFSNTILALAEEEGVEFEPYKIDLQRTTFTKEQAESFTGTYDWMPFDSSVIIGRDAAGNLVFEEVGRESWVALIPRTDGSAFLPMYDAFCEPASGPEKQISCRFRLSGDGFESKLIPAQAE